jgi:putative pyruvate formate lyase activating enzyme
MEIDAWKQAGYRAELARRSLKQCQLCPRNCGVDRTVSNKGYCRMDNSVRCFREVLHWGEEKELNPSHQVYFAGCNLKCEFCTVAEWNERPEAAEKADIGRLAEVIAQRKKQGARNLNLLGGEPAVSVHGILELLSQIDASTTVVWNSNMYYTDFVDDLIAGLVDICLADLKCGNGDCAQRLLGSADYLEVVKRNILLAAGHCDLIIRHLVLPGHAKCCFEPILDWISAELPTVKLSLRGNYVPPAQVKASPGEYLPSDEFRRAVDFAARRGLMLVQ